MREIAEGSVNKVVAMCDDPAHADDIKRASFLSALDGIRNGSMTYKDDALLPAIESEMAERLQKFKGLTREEEIAILALSDEQRKLLASSDKKMKNEFLKTPPNITHGAIKGHDKYKSYMKMVEEAA